MRKIGDGSRSRNCVLTAMSVILEAVRNGSLKWFLDFLVGYMKHLAVANSRGYREKLRRVLMGAPGLTIWVGNLTVGVSADFPSRRLGEGSAQWRPMNLVRVERQQP